MRGRCLGCRAPRLRAGRQLRGSPVAGALALVRRRQTCLFSLLRTAGDRTRARLAAARDAGDRRRELLEVADAGMMLAACPTSLTVPPIVSWQTDSASTTSPCS